MISASKTVPNPYDLHYFSPLGENDDFLDFFQKIMKNMWKLEYSKDENMKITENHRKNDFHKVLTHVGAGKSAFPGFLWKSWKFTKIH